MAPCLPGPRATREEGSFQHQQAWKNKRRRHTAPLRAPARSGGVQSLTPRNARSSGPTERAPLQAW
ncbi:Hypothetical predicted protein, partial [Pelobates cultripes]